MTIIVTGWKESCLKHFSPPKAFVPSLERRGASVCEEDTKVMIPFFALFARFLVLLVLFVHGDTHGQDLIHLALSQILHLDNSLERLSGGLEDRPDPIFLERVLSDT